MRTIARAVIGVLLVVLGALSPSLIAQRIDGGVRLNGITQGITIASPTLTGTVNIGNTAAAPSLIVSATAVTSGVPLQLPNGSGAAPALFFAGGTTDGFLHTSGGTGVALDGVERIRFDKGLNAYALTLRSDAWLTWGGFGLGTPDIVARRSAAKTITWDADGAGGALTLFSVVAPANFANRLDIGSANASQITIASSVDLAWGSSGIGSVDNDIARGGPQILIFSNGLNGGTGFRLNYATDGTAQFLARAGADTAILKANVVNPTGTYQVNGALAISATAPTVTAGFGSGVAGTVTKNTGTMIVQVTVGTNAGGTTGTLTFPSAPTGWACTLSDVTTTTDLTRQTGFTQTTAAFSTTVAWTTGDVLVGVCGPF